MRHNGQVEIMRQHALVAAIIVLSTIYLCRSQLGVCADRTERPRGPNQREIKHTKPAEHASAGIQNWTGEQSKS
jgi:hypothetical protein